MAEQKKTPTSGSAGKNADGLVIEAKVKGGRVVLVRDSLERFNSEFTGTNETQKVFTVPHTLRIQSDEGTVEKRVTGLQLRATGLNVEVVSATDGKRFIPLYNKPAAPKKAAEQRQEILTQRRSFSIEAAGPLSITVSKSGEIDGESELMQHLRGQGGDIIKALLKRNPVDVRVAEGSTVRVARDQPVEVTKITLRLDAPTVRLIGAARGAKVVRLGEEIRRQALRAAPAPDAAQPAKKQERATRERIIGGVYHPLVQVVQQVEKELMNLLLFIGTLQQRELEKKQAEGRSPSKQPTPWPKTLVQVVRNAQKQWSAAQKKEGFVPADPEVTGQWLASQSDRVARAAAGLLENRLSLEHPTFTASILLELLETGTCCGKDKPEKAIFQLRTVVREFVAQLASGEPIGKEPYTRSVSRDVRTFAHLAQSRYEYKGVQEDKGPLHFTDRRKPWNVLINNLRSDNRTIRAAAFQQVLSRVVDESSRKAAPSEKDVNEEIRRQYDQNLLTAMQLARQSNLYLELTADKKRSVDNDFSQATRNIAQRRLIDVDTDWMATEALRRRKGKKGR